MNPSNRQTRIEEEASRWFYQQLDRPLSASEEARLQQWLEEPSHAAEYARVQAIWQDMEQLPLRAMLNTTAPARSPAAARAASTARAPRRWMLGGAIAAGLTCLVWAIGMYLPLENLDVRTGGHETRVTTLTDGSRITANVATHLRIRTMLLRRTVALEEGEAFFEVAPNRHRPFEVATSQARVRVTGTAFNVLALPARLEVAVSSGQVEVFTRRENSDMNVLRQGETASIHYDGDNPNVVTAKRAPSEAGAWRDGILVVHQETLATVMQKMARYLPVAVTFDDEQAGSYLLSGTIDIRRPRDFMRNLPLLAPVRVDIEPADAWRISSRK